MERICEASKGINYPHQKYDLGNAAAKLQDGKLKTDKAAVYICGWNGISSGEAQQTLGGILF